ncbi:MAG: GDSL-type esterase/lipase family protein, partial [Bacteroidota bacterium]
MMKYGILIKNLWGLIFCFSILQIFGNYIFAQSRQDDLWYLDYGFINYEDNRVLSFQPNALNHFFTKLQRLETKKDCQVQVMHLGDSHIQADMFSGKVREKIMQDQRFPMSARGFVFPYSAARTNNPYNYKTFFSGGWTGKRSVRSKDRSRWGMSGISIETNAQGASFSLHPNIENFNYAIRKVKIFYPNTDPNSFDIVPKISIENSISGYFVGDGYVEFTFRKPLTAVELVVTKSREGQSKFVLQGVTLENTEPGVIYSASGVNSADVNSYFRCQDFEKNVGALSPDLVIISLGTNDAYMYAFNRQQFKTNMRILVSRIKNASPQTSILLTTPADNFRRRRYPNKN